MKASTTSLFKLLQEIAKEFEGVSADEHDHTLSHLPLNVGRRLVKAGFLEIHTEKYAHAEGHSFTVPGSG